ncbi:biosynthetic peptidoglycan transglycosylase [Alicyclobacillus macrosporangiidus]|uniref:biosynthetic peptidoglycan transglycosylase n=1 Tax=Alicyclobacillus macrosporangiidus TaxID=392015 RepID=UPI0026E93D76|nr:biosynthetic peptidoglycan transglycosylase [Alicyclobacillus macrosporangiidus]
MRRVVRRLVKLFIFVLVAGCASWYGLKMYFTRLHPVAPKVRQEVLAQIQAHGSRYLTYDQIPEVYRNAVIATEDRSFFTNIGVDFQGIARAMWVDIRQQQPMQGGSTITQQLVHNTLLKDIPKSLSWKVKETVLRYRTLRYAEQAGDVCAVCE